MYQPSSSSPSLVGIDVLVGDAELVLGHDRAGGVGDDVGQADREHDERRDEQRGEADQAAAAVAPGAVALGAARAPQRDRAAGDQGEPGGEREEAGEVVARGADLARVVDGLDAGGHAERAEEQGEQCRGGVPLSRGYAQAASASSAVGISPLARWSVADVPGLRLDEAVVEDVERDQRDRDPREDPSLTRMRAAVRAGVGRAVAVMPPRSQPRGRLPMWLTSVSGWSYVQAAGTAGRGVLSGRSCRSASSARGRPRPRGTWRRRGRGRPRTCRCRA